MRVTKDIQFLRMKIKSMIQECNDEITNHQDGLGTMKELAENNALIRNNYAQRKYALGDVLSIIDN